MITKERIEFLWNQTDTIYSDLTFDNYRKSKTILATMPDIENHQESINKAIRLIETEGVSSILIACYHGALLTKQQEQHLFRKYNFLKFKMRQLLEGPSYNIKRMKRYEKAEALYTEIVNIQNILIVSNLRLVPNQCNKYPLKLHEMLIEDGYYSLLKCIPNFDWTRGYKFSTYAVWAIVNNFKRALATHYKYYEQHQPLTEKTETQGAAGLPWNEIYQREDIQVVTSYVNQLEDKREKFVLKSIYGLDGHVILPHQEIADNLKISTKFVQEIRRRAICKIRVNLGLGIYVSQRQLKKKSKNARKVA